MIISVKEAHAILGNDANDMTDDEIEYVIETLDLMAKRCLKTKQRRTPQKT